MNVCSQAGCGSNEVRCYKLYLRDKYTLLCSPCASSLTAIGMSLTLVERRQTDMAVVVERRHTFIPRWLRHLPARDETGRLAA